MARVLIPQMPRSYNHNPRGSSTATVVMRSDNPFERRTTLTNGQLAGGALPGMSGLGDEPGALMDPPKPAAGTDWSAIAAALVGAGAQVGTAAIQNHYAPNQSIPSPLITRLNAINANSVKKPGHTVLPWALGGGALVIGLGALYFMMRR